MSRSRSALVAAIATPALVLMAQPSPATAAPNAVTRSCTGLSVVRPLLDDLSAAHCTTKPISCSGGADGRTPCVLTGHLDATSLVGTGPITAELHMFLTDDPTSSATYSCTGALGSCSANSEEFGWIPDRGRVSATCAVVDPNLRVVTQVNCRLEMTPRPGKG